MKFKKILQLSLFVFGCLLINYVGKYIASTVELPLWLDSIGTFASAYYLGPVCGAIVGAATNIIYGIHFPSTIFYVAVNLATGILVGIFGKKGFLRDAFGAMTTAFFTALVAVILSLPLNFIIYDGSSGNAWGDGIIEYVSQMGFNKYISCFVGEFFIDFTDKIFSVFLLYVFIRHNAEKTRRKNINNMTAAFAVAAVSLGVIGSLTGISDAEAYSQGESLKNYVSTIYNNDNGLPCGAANDIVQTKDGVLWIATYSGLYRYCGNEIELMDSLDSVRTVNCLYNDESGRLWIGTNDNGITIFINDDVSKVINSDDGLPADSVRSTTQSSTGLYYAGTTDALAVISISGGMRIYDIIPDVMYTTSLSADSIGNVAAVTDDGTLYLIRDTEILAELKSDDDFRYAGCAFDAQGRLFVGSSQNVVTVFDVSNGNFNELYTVECGSLTDMNSLTCDERGVIYICADNGAGFINGDKGFGSIDVDGFNSSIEHMLTDYQGNLWFTSSRLGLLCLCQSVFTEINKYDGLSGNVVNTVIKWQNTLYVGTDCGLDCVGGGKIYDIISERLGDTRVRCLMEDSVGRLWICTSGEGVWCVSQDGEISIYNSSCGAEGNKFRTALELSDGTVAVGGDYGITFIKNDKVIDTICDEDGLTNPKVLTLCELWDGTLLAGTNGNGVAVIDDGKVSRIITHGEGLSSDIILKIIPDGDEGVFVVTGNAICYMNRNMEIRILDNFPYSNNFDIVANDNGELFVLCSAGIYVTDREELLSGSELNCLLLDSQRGLRLTLTPNSRNYVDENGVLYLSGDYGVAMLDLSDYEITARSYRIMLRGIKADGDTVQILKGGQTVIPSGTAELELTPEIINFSTNDPYIRLFMEGYDTEPVIIPQSKLTTQLYTNIPSGEYVFHLEVLDNRTQRVISENSYSIVVEKKIYENGWFRIYFFVMAVAAIVYITWLAIKPHLRKTLRVHNMELELAKNQIRMSNETILTIAKAVDAKDENTSQHSVRVSEYSVMIAKRLGYREDAAENLRKIAILHDIGKIGIPDSVLNKPAKLTDEEYGIMKSHVERGAEILKSFTMIENVAEGALYHHERYDGKGYTHGLKGEEIPLNARIIGIADAFDAMTANRVYRKKLDFEVVLEELRKGRGTQFDPKLTDIMLELIADGTIDVEQIYGKKLSDVKSLSDAAHSRDNTLS